MISPVDHIWIILNCLDKSNEQFHLGDYELFLTVIQHEFAIVAVMKYSLQVRVNIRVFPTAQPHFARSSCHLSLDRDNCIH